jgi:hypothetical protein
MEHNSSSRHPEKRRTNNRIQERYAENKHYLSSLGVTAGMVGLCASHHLWYPGPVIQMANAVNAAVLGGITYCLYTNWDKPAWGRRTISTAAVGLLMLWGSEP